MKNSPNTLLLAALLSLSLTGPVGAGAPEAASKPVWKTARTETFGSLTFAISEPVLVGRSKGRLWFPTITGFDDGKLMALMSAEPDVVGAKPGKLVTWSTDGGLTWSEAEDGRGIRGGGTIRLPDGQRMIIPFAPAAVDDGSIAGPSHLISGPKQEIHPIDGNVTVSGFLRPLLHHPPKPRVCDCSINRQAIETKDGGYLGTLYVRFAGTKRLTLLLIEVAMMEVVEGP